LNYELNHKSFINIQFNTFIAATVDEEIPEEIESFDDTHELQFESENNSSNVLSVTASRNLPGSSWLQTKRAQVRRCNLSSFIIFYFVL